MFLIKKNFFCIFIFLLVLASSNLYAETFFLINPSVQCKGHLENSFKKYLYKEKDLFILNFVKQDTNIKKRKNREFEVLYEIQGNNAYMILSKVKGYQTGTLTILNNKEPCRSIFSSNKEYAFANSKNSNLESFNSLEKNTFQSSLNTSSDLPNCNNNDRIKYWSDCFGKYIFSDGNEYIGEFKNGKLEGKGTFKFLNGDVYSGQFRDNKYNGNGRYSFVDGRYYVGEFNNGKYEGFGIYTFTDGSRDVGQWLGGKLNGQAIQFNTDGSIYRQGIFKDDKFLHSNNLDQKEMIPKTDLLPKCSSTAAANINEPLEWEWDKCLGVIKIKDGKYKGWNYEGEFQNGRLHGYGTVNYADGGEYVGQFKMGKKHGKGTLIYGPNSKWAGDRYIGEYFEGKKNGYGTYTYSNGKKYIGEWIDNKRDGFGTNVWPDGSKYIGEWKEGKQNGVGTFTFSNGAKDVGEWKENKLNGEAIQYFANGNIFRQGVFRDDQFLYEKKTLLETDFEIPDNAYRIGDSWNCKEGFEKVGDKCLEKVFSKEFIEIQKKAIDLERQLAEIKEEKQQKQMKVRQDDQIPLISNVKHYFIDTNAVIGGKVTDNIEVAEVIIDNETVLLNDNSEFEFKLYVPRNGKSIKIVAYDLKGNKAVQNLELKRPIIENNSGPKFSLLNPNLNKVKANKTAIALIIGVANYEKTSAKAVFADRDAKMFYDYANLKLGIPKSNIKELVNESAEESEILLTIKDWVNRSVIQNESDIFVFFAGHGLASQDGENMYLLPYDGSPRLLEDTAILRDRLFNDLSKTKPRSVTVFLDTCYSGSSRSEDMLISSRPVMIVSKEKNIPKNFTVFSASANDQIAQPLFEVQHGLFSYFLMKGMEGMADKNNDKNITTQELHNYIFKNVTQQSSGEQTPQLQGHKDKIIISFE